MNHMLATKTKGTTLYGRVYDGTLDPPIEDGAVVFEGETIVWVGERTEMSPAYRQPEYEIVDLPGRTILPGLIDGHTHISFGEARSEEELALYTPVEFRTLKAAYFAPKVLKAGFTSAFDASTTFNIAANLRDAIDSGMFEGPRFAVCGRQLTNHQGLEDSFPNEMQFPPGQAGVLITSKDQLVEAVRYQAKDRIDCIKVSGSNDSLITPDSLDGSAMTIEELTIIADEAHRLGMLTAIHARSRDAVINAATAKFDIIYHASYIDDEGIDLCLANNCLICPTLTLPLNIIKANQGRAGVSSTDAFQREVDAAQNGLSKAYRAGIPFVGGSESGWSPIPFGHWHAYEMQTFVDMLGFSPIEAVHANTLAATRMLKKFGHKVGKLEAGRYADVIVVNGNPLKDVTLLQKKSRLDRVYKGGALVDLTPVPPRERMYFERHKIFLNALYTYDEETGEGVVEH